MKLFKILSILVLFFDFVIPAAAQDVSDYGSPLEIIAVDIDSLNTIYNETGLLDDYELYKQWENLNYSNKKPMWSPDGEWIAFSTSGNCIFVVSANGGIPIFFITDYQYETENERYYNIILDFCFTQDSREITFSKRYYDEEKGSDIFISEDEDGHITSVGFINPINCIESINIHTGERRVLADGRLPTWSHDGRYICYINFDYRQYMTGMVPEYDKYLTILDTTTGEKTFLTDGSNFSSYRFTPDDSAVIFSMGTGSKKSQLFKIPIAGGEPEQITFPIIDGDGTGNYRSYLDVSPDGEWILYKDRNFDKIYNFSSSDSTESWGTIGATIHLCLHHLSSGETYKIFPEPQDTNMWGDYGTFSPDGTKICYEYFDFNKYETTFPHIYIRDIDLDSYVLVEEEPRNFALLGNYPNPFNPTTTIQFTLPEADFVELTIYNISGQKIRELVAEYMSAGVHSSIWDGRDENGVPVSSGVFISRLKTRDNVFSNRMMLVR